MHERRKDGEEQGVYMYCGDEQRVPASGRIFVGKDFGRLCDMDLQRRSVCRVGAMPLVVCLTRL